jgi:FAD:protein FMN transferase
MSMGCEIVVEGASPPRAQAIEQVFARHDATFSRFLPQSELNRVNAHGGGRVSPLFAQALAAALWAREETDGMVEPTVGAAVTGAGYDRDFGSGLESDAPPGPPALPGRAALFGRIVVLGRGVALDLNGVVKALAVDEAAALLDGDGFVSAGGDLATRGPVDVAVPAGGAVRVTGGLATSGTTRRRWLRGGVPQHHLIDPRTGRPADSPWAEVTVAAATCLAADVAAKAALLAGPEGPIWLDRRGLPGRFVTPDGAVVQSSLWPAAEVAVPCI